MLVVFQATVVLAYNSNAELSSISASIGRIETSLQSIASSLYWVALMLVITIWYKYNRFGAADYRDELQSIQRAVNRLADAVQNNPGRMEQSPARKRQ